MRKQPVCPKCKGRLSVVIEYVDGGHKLDVIKCMVCGHRVRTRDHVEAPVASAPAKPAAHGKGEAPLGPTVEEQAPAPKAPASRRLSYIKKSAGDLGTPPCANCGRPGLKHPSRGLCARCWHQNKKAGTLGAWQKNPAPAHEALAAAAVPATATQKSPQMSVVLTFSTVRDRELYKKLATAAAESRRDLTQHVLWLLEQGVA